MLQLEIRSLYCIFVSSLLFWYPKKNDWQNLVRPETLFYGWQHIGGYQNWEPPLLSRLNTHTRTHIYIYNLGILHNFQEDSLTSDVASLRSTAGACWSCLMATPRCDRMLLRSWSSQPTGPQRFSSEAHLVEVSQALWRMLGPWLLYRYTPVGYEITDDSSLPGLMGIVIQQVVR